MRSITLATMFTLLCAVGACQSSPEDYELSAAPDAAPATSLSITETRRGKPSNDGMLHVLFMPSDLSTLYHEHPRKTENGKFVLDLPLVAPREYDVWVELTLSSGHHDAVLRRFTMPLKGGQPVKADPDEARVTFKPVKLDLQRDGKLSHVEVQILLDGKPAERFGKFVGVQVHSFAASKDRTFFVHDHADLPGQGVADAHFKFPRAGDYVVFLQPTVVTRDGKEIRTVLRHAVTVP